MPNVTHGFVSAVPDDPVAAAAGKVLTQSHWNARHLNVMGVFNVKDATYSGGAKGDGTTDDTTALNAAIAAFNSAGGGRLYLPKGRYIVPNGALTAITVPGIIEGDGGGFNDSAATVIQSNSGTAVLFTVSFTANHDLTFRDLTLYNSAFPTVSAGAGIQVTSTTAFPRINFKGIGVQQFYTNVDIQVNDQWTMDDCIICDPVHYGVRVQNTVNNDAGDWRIVNSLLITTSNAASGSINCPALLQWDSGNGCMVCNTKFNSNATVSGFGMQTAINGGLNNGGIFLISNCSIENYGLNGVNLGGAIGSPLSTVGITNCEFGGYGSRSTACIVHDTGAVNLTGLMFINGFNSGSFVQAIDLTNCYQSYAGPIGYFGRWNTNPGLGLNNPGTTGGTPGVFNNEMSGFPAATGTYNDIHNQHGNLSTMPGRRAFMTDCNTATPTLGAAASGLTGGSNVAPIFDDGTIWRIG